ncbi:3-phosphoshikimate 1-carboxyvinyltransferase [Dermabacteraceae bacterium P7006]
MQTHWSAPNARGPLTARVRVPGSKSLTNRWLLLAACADSPSVLRGALDARDCRLMRAALESLGAGFSEDGEALHVSPIPTDLAGADAAARDIDCGLAGTVMRFLPPLVAASGLRRRLRGDAGAYVRPMAPLLGALADLGVSISYEREPGFLPCVISSAQGLPGGKLTLDSSASSQFVSALLLAAPRARGPLTVRHAGGRLPSLPHIEMTVRALQDCGAKIETLPASADGGAAWRIVPGPLTVGEVEIEPDLSNAGVFLAAAMIAGGSVTVPGWPEETTQAGDAYRDLLPNMGARLSLGTDGLTCSGGGSRISGINADLSHAGELTCTIAALAALADSPSRLYGIGHLRGHETDRLAALVSEINRLGGDARELPDGIEIRPRPLHGGLWRSYSDHRMATAGALIGLAVPGVEVENVETTDKTLPGFTEMWREMLNGAA